MTQAGARIVGTRRRARWYTIATPLRLVYPPVYEIWKRRELRREGVLPSAESAPAMFAARSHDGVQS